MAYVSDGWEYSITVVDSGANPFTRTWDLVAADAAAAAAAAADIRTKFMAATDCVLKSARLSEKFIDDGYVLPANIEGENQALLVFGIEGSPTKKATFYVPGAKVGLFVAPQGKNRNVVDVADAAVTDLRGLYDQTTGVATISDGEYASFVESGKRVHVGSKKG